MLKKPAKKERGKLLTFLLILFTLFLLIDIRNVATNNINFNVPQQLTFNYQIYRLIDVILSTTVIAGIAFWKKWAVYASIALTVTEFFLATFAWGEITSLWFFLFAYSVSVIWYIAIYRKFQFFT